LLAPLRPVPAPASYMHSYESVIRASMERDQGRDLRAGWTRALDTLWWVVRFLVALFLFVGALQLMKTGAKSLDVLQPGGFLVKNAASTFGLGWLGALFVLSGSPIAATSLTLVKAGEEAAAAGAAHFTELQGFTMLTGSRLGAAFVVLVTAVIYALRGGEGERMGPLSTAVMALCTTALIYIPAGLIGFAILNFDPFHRLNLQFPGQFADLIGIVYDPVLERLSDASPLLVFLGGLGVLLLSFKLIDTVLPDLDNNSIERSRLGWLKEKWPMFGLGCLVALIVMSVSVALTVLVPLVAKGYAKREDILPYIMGANITTLGDTMLAAFALHSPAAVRIVLAEVIATSVLSVLSLAFFYPQIRRAIWRFQRQMVKSRTRLAGFTAGLFLVPIAVIVLAGIAS
jgi:solute carrier family 34 (sodium-dependent phosphate cotransporter)